LGFSRSFRWPPGPIAFPGLAIGQQNPLLLKVASEVTSRGKAPAFCKSVWFVV
jgi:hypothetical protein